LALERGHADCGVGLLDVLRQTLVDFGFELFEGHACGVDASDQWQIYVTRGGYPDRLVCDFFGIDGEYH
jgi:hypothetical protein